MSCDHQLITEHVHDYVDGKLPAALRRRCEQALAQCAQCRGVHEEALKMQRLAAVWRHEPVPSWHRTRYAVRPAGARINWLNLSSLAASLVAVLMVVLRLEISTDDGLWISLGGRQTEERMEAMLDRELATWRESRDREIDARLDDFAEARTAANRVMLAEWMERNREERRQDLDFILTAWESQRFQDQRRVDQLVDNQIQSNQYLNEILRDVTFPGRSNQ